MNDLIERLERLRRLVSARHARVIARLVGMQALTQEERDLLREIPAETLDLPTRSLIEEAYRFGRVLSLQPAEAGREDVLEQPVELSPAEEASVQIAAERAAQSVRNLAARTQNMVARGVIDAAARVRGEVASAVESRQTVANLGAALRRATGDLVHDWELTAATELQSARQAGYADNVRRLHGEEAEVFKRPMPDACSWCLSLHIGPDGHPRIFRLSDLEANGHDNTGRKKAEWLAVVGPVHPWCSCELVHMPSGWGFAADGAILPSGTGGIRYTAKSLAKSLEWERELQKAHKGVVSRLEYQGLSIAVENPPGSVRHWKDEQGREGQTKMLYAYGYVEGTLGSDGDGYDCYVGPIPDAPFVYVVHQRRPDTGELYDEDKAMLGFDSVHHATAAFLAHYDDPNFLGSLSQMPIEEFKQKVMRTCEPGQDGMLKCERILISEKSLANHLVDSQYGDRAVDTGTSGPNIGMMVPAPPMPAELDPPAMRAELEAFAARLDEQPILKLTPEVFNFRDFDNTPIHPTAEVQEAAAQMVVEDHEVADHREWIQRRLDRRVEAGETSHKLIPRERITIKETT